MNAFKVIDGGENELSSKILADLQEVARAGRLRSLAVVAAQDDGFVFNEAVQMAGEGHMFTLLGGLDNLSHRINMFIEESNE